MKILIFLIFIFLSVVSAQAEEENPLSDLYQRTYHISVKDDYLLASSTVGLTVYRIKENKLIHLSSLSIENSGASSIVEKDYLYLFAGNSGLYKIDIKNPEKPIIVKNIRLQGSMLNGDIYKNKIFVALGSIGFALLRTDSLEQIKYIETPSYCSFVKVLNSTLFVSTENDGLFVYSLKGNNLKFQYKIPLARRVRDIISVNDLILLANDTYGIVLLKNEKNKFIEEREYDTPDTARGMTVYKNYLFVADGNTGLVIFKIGSDKSLKHIKNFNTGYSANKVIVKDDFLLVSNDAMGILIIKIEDVLK